MNDTMASVYSLERAIDDGVLVATRPVFEPLSLAASASGKSVTRLTPAQMCSGPRLCPPAPCVLSPSSR